MNTIQKGMRVVVTARTCSLYGQTGIVTKVKNDIVSVDLPTTVLICGTDDVAEVSQ